MTIQEQETKLGKRWREFTQDEWDEVLKTTEVDDMKYPLIINKAMEAFMNERFNVLTKSVLAFIGIAILDAEATKG